MPGTFLVLAGFFTAGLAQRVLAEAKPNPYQTIIERNPFGLKPPPPPPDPTPPAPVTPPSKVLLTGFTSVSGPPRALLEITEQEPGKGATTHKPILREGERDGSVELISIDMEKGLVKIRNGGIESTVAFEAPKLTASATPPPGLGGIPQPLTTPLPNTYPPPNAANPAGSNPARPGVTIYGGGSPTTPNPSAGAVPPAGAAANFGAGGAGLRSIPSRALRTDNAPLPPVPGAGPPAFKY